MKNTNMIKKNYEFKYFFKKLDFVMRSFVYKAKPLKAVREKIGLKI